MLTSLEDPIIEVWRFSPQHPIRPALEVMKKLVGTFMDSADAAVFKNNPDGAPGVFVVDSSKPLNGLSAFGFEGVEKLEEYFLKVPQKKLLFKDSKKTPKTPSTESQPLSETNPESDNAAADNADVPTQEESTKPTNPKARIPRPLSDGEILILQARPNTPPTGDSTMLGKLRRTIFKIAIKQGLVKADRPQILWVTDFPLFTRNEGSSEPGQGGSAGISATHHPFTAPKSAEDVDLLLTDPFSARADHYDLVVDGVELGGGSRRIHIAEMQEFVMRDVLKVCSFLPFPLSPLPPHHLHLH